MNVPWASAEGSDVPRLVSVSQGRRGLKPAERKGAKTAQGLRLPEGGAALIWRIDTLRGRRLAARAESREAREGSAWEAERNAGLEALEREKPKGASGDRAANPRHVDNGLSRGAKP